MKKLITEIQNGELYQYYPLGKHVVRAIGVCGGRPTFKYTQIEIGGTLERLARISTILLPVIEDGFHEKRSSRPYNILKFLRNNFLPNAYSYQITSRAPHAATDGER